MKRFGAGTFFFLSISTALHGRVHAGLHTDSLGVELHAHTDGLLTEIYLYEESYGFGSYEQKYKVTSSDGKEVMFTPAEIHELRKKRQKEARKATEPSKKARLVQEVKGLDDLLAVIGENTRLNDELSRVRSDSTQLQEDLTEWKNENSKLTKELADTKLMLDRFKKDTAASVNVRPRSKFDSLFISEGSPVAMVTNPTGRGSKDISVIQDDIPVYRAELIPENQYDTFVSGEQGRTIDWIGYVFRAEHTFLRLEFQEGMHYDGGGWFDDLKIQVQVQKDGNWSEVKGVTFDPLYSRKESPGFKKYTITFDPVSGDGIRLWGRPGGRDRFISCRQLRVYGWKVNADSLQTDHRTK